MLTLSPDASAKYARLKSDTSRNFSAQPAIAQQLNEKVTAKADFLEKINVIPVTEIKGEKVMLGVGGPVTSRTDTNTADRQPKQALSLSANGYELSATESDVALPYAKIDAWAKHPDFLERYDTAVQKQIALDRMKIGFHGTHAASQTDAVTYPLLQDVNKGWLQQVREQAPDQVMAEGSVVAGKVLMGVGGDFANLDALVQALADLIEEPHRDGGDLIAIIGRDLLAADKAKLYAAQGHTPTEKERIETAPVSSTYGGLPSYSVPFFPANAVLVTSWENLSIYWQESSWRRLLVENPRRSRVEDYNSRNEGYVVELLEKIALAENVEPTE
ncbi:MAG: phage major capsid protein, P2 family [Pseudomonas sp.]|nr:phage major capsid protein, P2 family [Pseudomonas sp.]MBB61210.1 phage major capsid protein, P2 family [Pseudomonas sp.]|tara:strand:- start:7804 stop:8796 length:993 start_codon:yes stop_codon:yes gene_type:complete